MPPAATSDDALTGTDQVAETDAGPTRSGAVAEADPQRRCIATMESRSQHDMSRFVLAPDSVVTPDLAGRLPGRGAWVTATREAVELAAGKSAFARAFRSQARLPADLATQVEQLLSRRILDQLGLAKRAGELILGFEQVREAIRQEKPACLIEASDGAADGRDKVLALVRGVHSAEGERLENLELPPVIGCFSADELGMALGRERVIHACLKQGRFANSWMGELARLSGFRPVFWPAGWPS
ncbi:MAG TPA: RNA-binding protein, partial [Hyphomonadaceae bacterium]|nr:RNA-binding protein [Hyphomonadaceae bacterium]